jgi:hypothetical protein
MPKRKILKMNSSDIIFGAKSIISGMFRHNEEFPELDDSYFMPMLKTCINETVENLGQAGLSQSDIEIIYDSLYQHSLSEYVKACLSCARQNDPDIDEEEETEDAKDSFVSFYEESGDT